MKAWSHNAESTEPVDHGQTCAGLWENLPGAVCAHSCSAFIPIVSKQPLIQFSRGQLQYLWVMGCLHVMLFVALTITFSQSVIPWLLRVSPDSKVFSIHEDNLSIMDFAHLKGNCNMFRWSFLRGFSFSAPAFVHMPGLFPFGMMLLTTQRCTLLHACYMAVPHVGYRISLSWHNVVRSLALLHPNTNVQHLQECRHKSTPVCPYQPWRLTEMSVGPRQQTHFCVLEIEDIFC